MAGLAIVLLSISAAGGASFTLSDAALMSLDWNEQDYYAQPLKARILERRDIPGPGVEYDIFFPSSIGMDRCLTCISSWRGGSGALVGLNVSMYATYDLLFTLKSVNGGQSTNEGDWVTVGAMIGPFGTSSGAYRPFMLDTNPSDWLPDYVAAWTDVKTSQLKIIGFTLGLMPQTNNHWNPQGTTLTLLVQPAPGAVQLFPRPRQVTLEKFGAICGGVAADRVRLARTGAKAEI